MVKIQLKSALIGLIMFVMLISIANAASTKLIITNVDAKVGTRTIHNIQKGSTIIEDARPGDQVQVMVDVKNNFSSNENFRIRSILVKGTIAGIDDGNDLDDESSSFDLAQGSSKRVTLKFQVPIQVSEDSFNMQVTTEGEDQNNTIQQSDFTAILNVNKRSHQLIFLRDSLNPSSVSCRRNNIRLDTSFANIGSDDENLVNIEISNSELGLNIKDTATNLLAEANDPASVFSKVYSFKISNDVLSGTYPISVSLSYNQDRIKTQGTATLEVNDCKTAVVPNTNAQNNSPPIQLVTPTTETTATTQQQVPPNTTVSQEGFLGSNTLVIVIVIIEVIAVVAGIIVLVTLFGRRR